jgi:hypothetical protein
MARPVDVGAEQRVTPEKQDLPELIWIPIANLVVDDRYQRPLGKNNWSRIRNIARSFRWSRFSPVLVAPRCDGTYALVDGQHRAHAALLCGFSSVPAMSVEMDDSEQARSFSWVNDQVTRISTFHIFKAALAAGDDWAVRSNTAVSEAGCKLMTANSSTMNKKAGEIFAIALIRTMIGKDQDELVTKGLKALRTYDQTDRVAIYSAIILKPWLAAVSERPQLTEADLTEFLSLHDPYRVLNKIAKIRQESGKAGKTPIKMEIEAFLTLMDQWNIKKSAEKVSQA